MISTANIQHLERLNEVVRAEDRIELVHITPEALRRRRSHNLRVYLAQPGRKLENDPSHPVHLLTEAGMGYGFQA